MSAAQFIVAVIPSVAVIIAAYISNRKLDVIHVLVNNRLTEALEKIQALESKLSDSENSGVIDELKK